MTQFTEEWKPVVGFEGIYEVSNRGNVKRIVSVRGGAKPGSVMTPKLNTTGYLQVTLSRNNGKLYVKVHKLVAAAFLGPRPEGHQINHKDADKTNPNLENLEYVTVAENVAHAVRNGLFYQGEKCHAAKLNPDKVREIRNLSGTMSQRAIAIRFGIGQQAVSNVVTRCTWKHIT